MPTKPLDRLMFAQGGMCFFCEDPLTKADASVEHLVASANGGRNDDDNCVVCCKAMNALLGISSTIRSLLQKDITDRELSMLLQRLEAEGVAIIEGAKVSYAP